MCFLIIHHYTHCKIKIVVLIPQHVEFPLRVWPSSIYATCSRVPGGPIWKAEAVTTGQHRPCCEQSWV